jgi:hypothetical protein
MRLLCLTLVAGLGLGRAEMVDRISLIVEGRLVKHSDIVRDIRLTALLNHEAVSLTLSEQKKAVARLIDQTLIRKELQAGLYPSPKPEEVEALLQQFKKSYGSDAAYRRALNSYGISEDELRRHLGWQLTVLRFVNTRFATGIQVPDEDVRSYYQKHLPDFRKAGKPKLDLESLRPEIQQSLTGDQVNGQFFKWLDEAEKSSRIVYNEEALK